MSDKFSIEIISPEKTILKSETREVTIPSFEGQMGILKDHIPLITFLRPGIILIKDQEEKKYYVEEGIVEFSNNKLLILTSTANNLKNFEIQENLYGWFKNIGYVPQNVFLHCLNHCKLQSGYSLQPLLELLYFQEYLKWLIQNQRQLIMNLDVRDNILKI